MSSPVPWYLNPLVVTPAFSLLGVVIGGVIAFGSSYFLDRMRAKREVKCAARLIALEIALMRTVANSCVETKTWPNPQVPALVSISKEARQKYLDAIAPHLSSDACVAVILAVQAAEAVKVTMGKIADKIGDKLLTTAVPDNIAEGLLPLIKIMNKGVNALAPQHGFFSVSAVDRDEKTP